MEQALRLFEHTPPSSDHAEAWFDYAILYVFHVQGRLDAAVAALDRSLEIAEAAGATGLVPRIYTFQASFALFRGQVEQGFTLIERARASAAAAGDDAALLRLAVNESDALLKTGKFASAAEVAQRGLEIARKTGRQVSFEAILTASNGAEALIAMGCTAEAAALIDPLTTEPPHRDHQDVDAARVEIDLLRGHIDAATRRQQQLDAAVADIASVEVARELAQRAAELAVWVGAPGDAINGVLRVLRRIDKPDVTILCGRLLMMGMRACADLAGQGRARRDDVATRLAVDAADELAAWVDRMGGAPFTDHPVVATIPGERASWAAERTRLAGATDPAAWRAAVDAWEALGCPHRAGYAGWRHAEARLLAGEPPAAVADTLRAAAAAADGHVPLRSAIRALADRVRVPLDTPILQIEPHSDAAPYGLTEREMLVLRLLAAGRSNGEIGAELFISRKTASAHVSHILRKLGVSTRVQAAALAERAGLVSTTSTPLSTRSPR